MALYYQVLTSLSGIDVNPELLKSMEKENEEQLKKLDICLAEAEKTEGESEILDALKERANHLIQIGDKEFPSDATVTAQQLALEKTPGLGSRIDITLTLVQIGFFGDNTLITDNLAKAEKLDRQNHPKVYCGLHAVSIWQFNMGGKLLLDALSTAMELILYNDLVKLTIIINILTLARVDLKKKLIASPEVISVLLDLPALDDLLHSLYDCHFAKFFIVLNVFTPFLIFPDTRYYICEMHILTNAQLLESYWSMTLESLDSAFGTSVNFIDRELSWFIASGHLHCTINKVHGIMEMTRPSTKMAQYEKVVKWGDVLLNLAQ
ncbi:26S proteasome subunit RPN7-domain-containing protein [Pisolithus marmoratus]|nr:26S proteasome subunit RPN7-domain-containing protein [Pisolithus marmoratus]